MPADTAATIFTSYMQHTLENMGEFEGAFVWQMVKFSTCHIDCLVATPSIHLCKAYYEISKIHFCKVYSYFSLGVPLGELVW
jgi:fucose permease